jgi:hypothetical protein
MGQIADEADELTQPMMPTDDKLFVDAENFKMYIYKQIRRFASMQFNNFREKNNVKSMYYTPG